MRNKTMVGAVICLLVVMVGGCGANNSADSQSLTAEKLYQPNSSSSPSTSSPTNQESTKSDETLGASPLEQYFLSPDKQDVVEQAIGKMTTACMAEKGYAYTPPAYTSSNVSEEEAMRTVWGTDNVDTARKHGYRLDDSSTSSTKDQPQGDEDKPGYLQALINEDDNGCIDLADKELGYYDKEWRSLMGTYDDIRMTAQTGAEADQRVETAKKEWSECMKKDGFTYHDPREAIEQFGASSDQTASEQEKQVAEHDAKCKVETHFITTLVSVQHEYEEKAAKDNIATLTAIKERSDQIYAKAQQLLGQ